ncbi:adenylosuccinate lyase family protein [Salinicola corii]|uniref:Adenylosuccinate lyase family protein n=1 Tax=Salinicola corii TaxID=2606937 RepID=A0A640WEY9_9GAMM|nr:lyase family protein [Salinicola corii]KAA0018717.1 adenylosuccinate lyase family protein [Salinicola corii]
MTDALPSPADVSRLFTGESRLQSWLDIEAALALAEAELGMIPRSAAETIASNAQLASFDTEAFSRLAARNRAPVLALVETLAAACGEDAGAYVHWGGTTQNIIQTGRILQMKKAHEALMRRLGSIFARLATMADESAFMLVAGRSNRRQGLPITFGFKVAAWVDEMLRHEERLRGAQGRVFVSQFGGALGAMHAFGNHGPALNVRISERLGLIPARIPSRAALDHIVEYLQLLALLGGTCAKIAQEFYTLMTDEIGEALEDVADAVGSSTMPQKVNSKIGVRVIASATRLRGHVAAALEAMQPSHEGDVSSNLVMYAVIDEGIPLAYELVTSFDEMLGAVKLDSEAMRHNLEGSNGLIMAEKAMMLLAPHIGRNEAHHRVQASVKRARKDHCSFAKALASAPDLPDSMDRATLEAELRPESYTGQSEPMAREGARRAREAADRLG